MLQHRKIGGQIFLKAKAQAGLALHIVGANVNVRSAFTFTFTFTSAFSAVNAAANAREREPGSMNAQARLSRVLIDSPAHTRNLSMHADDCDSPRLAR